MLWGGLSYRRSEFESSMKQLSAAAVERRTLTHNGSKPRRLCKFRNAEVSGKIVSA